MIGQRVAVNKSHFLSSHSGVLPSVRFDPGTLFLTGLQARPCRPSLESESALLDAKIGSMERPKAEAVANLLS